MTEKYRLYSIIAIVLMAMLCVVPAVAAESSSDHLSWTPWDSATSLPTATGSYYLTSNVSLNETWDVPAGAVNLCLNGYSITFVGEEGTVINVPTGTDFTLYDCIDTSKITGGKTVYHGSGVGGGISVASGSTFTMNGGNITGNDAYSTGGGVYIAGNGAFTMNSGYIAGNDATYGGGVHIASNATFTMNGGNIAGNAAYSEGGGVCTYGIFTLYNGSIRDNIVKATKSGGGGVSSDGTLIMEGGSITNNTAYDGGGVLSRDTFTMSGGAISHNSAYVGGGVSTGNATMFGGTIANNTATYGGGVSAGGTFTMYNGDIVNNTRAGSDITGVPVGGGVYSHGIFTMYGGNITGNVGGGGVATNSYSTFTMGGGTITGNSYGTSVPYRGTFTLFGLVNISGNEKYNLSIPDNEIIIINSTGLSEGSKIGVKVNRFFGEQRAITETNNADYAKFFFADNSSYKVEDVNNVLYITYQTIPQPIPSNISALSDTRDQMSAVTPPRVIYELDYSNFSKLTAPVLTHGGNWILMKNISVIKNVGEDDEEMPVEVDVDGKLRRSGAYNLGDIYSVTFDGRVLGDVTNDKKADTLDAARILQASAKLYDLDREAKFYGDVSADGETNTLDAARILQYSAKLTDENYNLIS